MFASAEGITLDDGVAPGQSQRGEWWRSGLGSKRPKRAKCAAVVEQDCAGCWGGDGLLLETTIVVYRHGLEPRLREGFSLRQTQTSRRFRGDSRPGKRVDIPPPTYGPGRPSRGLSPRLRNGSPPGSGVPGNPQPGRPGCSRGKSGTPSGAACLAIRRRNHHEVGNRRHPTKGGRIEGLRTVPHSNWGVVGLSRAGKVTAPPKRRRSFRAR